MKRALRFIWKLIKWLLITVLSLFLLIAILVHLPPVQNFILKKSTGYFNEQTGGQLSIEEIDLRLPFYLQLEGLVLKSPESEKIASIDNFEISIGWRKAFFQTISLDDIYLKGVDANLNANKAGTWNYQFIVDGFSQGDTLQEDTANSSSWDVSVSNVRLKNINFQYENGQSGDTLHAEVGSFLTSFQRMSVLNQVFLIDNLELSHSSSYFSMGTRPEETDAAEPENSDDEGMILSLKTLSLNTVESYSKIPGTGVFDVNVGELKLSVNKFNLDLNQYLVDQLKLKNSQANLTLASAESEDTQEPSSIFPNLNFRLDEVELKKNKVSLSMENDSLTHGLELKKLRARKLIVDSSRYAITLDELSLLYNDFPELNNLSTDILLTNRKLSIDRFKLNTEHSEIRFDLMAEYPSFQGLIEDYLVDRASLNLNNLQLGQQDLNTFKNKYLKEDSLPEFKNDIFITASIESESQRVYLSPFNIEYGNSELNLEALKNSLDFNEYEGEIQSLSFTLGNPLKNQIASQVETETLKLPETLELKLSGSNYGDSAHVDINLNTSAGNIRVRSNANLSDTSHIPVRAKIQSEGLHTGKIFTSSPESLIKFKLEASSENILKYDSLSQANLAIDTLFYEVPLKNINADFLIKNGLYKTEIAVRDTFVDTDILAHVSLTDTTRATADIKVNGVDLQGLGLTKTDIRAKTRIQAAYTQFNNVQSGQVELTGPIVVKQNENYDLKPLLANFYFDDDTTDIEFSGLINAYSRSNRDIESLAEKLPSLINETYKLNDDTTAIWVAELELGEAPIIREIFIPELTEFSGVTAQLDYHSSQGHIKADVDLPKLVYSDFFIDSLSLSTGSDSSVISRMLSIKKLGYDTLRIENLNISSLEDREQTSIEIKTQRALDSLPNYVINGSLNADTSRENHYNFYLRDTLVLNHEKWSIDEDKFHFSDSTSYGKISISSGPERFSLFREENSDELSIAAENFELVNLLSITQEDSLVSGTFTGNLTSTPESYKGKGRIDNFAVLHSKVGNLSWSLERDDKTRVEIASEGGHLTFETQGEISFPKNADPQLNITTNLQRLDLKMASELYPEYVLGAEGSISGELGITGTTKEPELNGSFSFNQASISTVYTGSNLKIQKSKIDLTNDKINLNTITLVDSAGSKLTISGEIRDYQEDISDVDISIDSDGFTLVDVSPENGVLVYGKLIADLNIDISKRLDAPKIKAKVKITKGTDFTYKVPPDDDYETFDNDLIQWTSLDTFPNRDEILTREKEKLNSKVDVFANTIDFDGQVEIVEETTLRVLIDSAAGDYLEIQGDAKISVNYNRAGNLRMVGNYYVADGFYQMNFYNIAKKKFKLKKGGYVNWSGSAFNPSLNLSAIYTTRATLTNLMMTESNSTVNPAYQQSLPFNVIMSIEGEVEDPEIAFDIRLDEENRGALNGAVDSRLSILRREQSEMNKQVFALLVFQTFMPAGSSGNPNLIENQARSSASQILSQELNKYGDQLIKGVDVNFDLQSYGGAQGTGNTDLTVDVAKSFFDNRVVVRLGSTIALEQNINTGNNDPFNTNVVVEYLITKDGRYRFLGYSKTNLEDIVVGRITRTGAGLVFQRDFDRFRYLLNPKSKPDYVKEEDKQKEENIKNGSEPEED